MNWLQGRYATAIAIGAIFGALSRFYATELVKSIWGREFGFYGTFLTNVTGCLIIAYILTLATELIRNISPELRLMTTTGFCGAYTTFSSYELEARDFLEKGNITMLVIYLIGSAIVSMIAIQAGVLLARASNKNF
ncbi:MAG TPA: fluoride efflux transporter CrcB [Pseudanabaena sp.]|nr:fluoride efflux transporter CrcB [Pseudanabaena sp.]